MPGRRDVATLLAVTAVVIAADQTTKAAVVAAIGPGRSEQRIALAGQWLSLEYAENRGIAFGVLAGLGAWVAAAAVLVLAALLIHYARTPKPSIWETVAVGAITGGAVGNLIDRARVGHVVDFISVGPWPNFNLADSAITVGVALLVWGWFIEDHDPAMIRED